MKTYLCTMFRQEVWVLLLAVLVPVGIAGCGSADEEAATKPPAETAAEQSAKTSPPAEQPYQPLKLLAEMEVDVIDVDALAFAPDSRTFVTGGGIPTLWKIGDKEPLHQFEDLYPLTGTIVEADAVDISADGKLLAIAGGDGKIHLFDLTTKDLKQTIEAHETGIVSITFSQDGQTIVSSGYDGLVKTWKTDSAAPLAVIDTKIQKSVFSDISPDGKTVVSTWDDVVLWNAETGEQIGPLALSEPRAISVRAVKFSPDGKQVATADATNDFENAAMIWSVDERKITATLKHEFGVGSMAFSPDGKMLATTDLDVRARVWDIAAKKLLQTIEEENATPDIVAWSADGKLLAVSSDGTIRFYGQPGTIEGLSAPSQAKPKQDPPLHEADAVGSPADEPKTPPAASVKLPEAATMEQLVAMLDLEEFPRIEGGDYQTTEKNNIGYLAPLTIPQAREFYREKLSAAGWQEQEQSVAALDTDQSWLRIYEKEGYLLRLYFNTLGDSVEGQITSVEFLHMGNIDTRELPAPAGGEITFETPEFTSYTAEIDADEAIETCRRQITALGWKEESVDKSTFGAAIKFVQNAITLTARIQPGTGGKTLVMYDVAAHAK